VTCVTAGTYDFNHLPTWLEWLPSLSPEGERTVPPPGAGRVAPTH
jgi:hypothetical protein